jgi:preprotein translocase subunit SecB
MLRAGEAPATRPLDRRPLGARLATQNRKTTNMAEDAPAPETSDPASNGNDSLPQVGVLAQYVKDLSFENPNAPAVYQWQGQPQMDVQFNIGTQPVGQDVHEVVLKVEIEAKGNEGVAFRIELLYAGLFALRNIPTEQLQPFLLAEAPRLLFPFARRLIADASIDGGFPPLLLDPIDFAGLYMQSAAQQQGGEGGDIGGGLIPDETGQA